MKVPQGTHVRTQQRKLSRKEVPEINLGFEARGSAAGHQRPAGLERSHAFIPGSRADVLHNNIRAGFVGDLADFVGDLLLVVVDNEIGAEFEPASHFTLVSSGRNHTCIEESGDLDGCRSHSGTCAQYQYGLPRAQPSARHQHMPRGCEYQRDAGRFIESQLARNRKQIDRRDSQQFAVAAIHRVTQHSELRAFVLAAVRAGRALSAEMHGRNHDSLPDLKSFHILADFDDFPSHIAAGNMRQTDTRQALAHPKIKMIHSTGAHADQHLILARPRIGRVFILQHFRAAELMNADCLHGSLSSCSAGAPPANE